MTDFGLSRKTQKTTNVSNDSVLGVVPYVDPKYLNNIKSGSERYTLNQKSDVYSVGILLWQISSGHRPFYDEDSEYDVNLIMKIKEGKRENVVKGTPVRYSDLYEGKYYYNIPFLYMRLNRLI